MAEIIESTMSDYLKFRGKCKELSEAEVSKDPALRLVRGWYLCPIWRTLEPHWWCVRPDGTIVDPTKDQFPSRGHGDYEEFDGIVTCSECGKQMQEADAEVVCRYAFCSYACHGKFVGVL